MFYLTFRYSQSKQYSSFRISGLNGQSRSNRQEWFVIVFLFCNQFKTASNNIEHIIFKHQMILFVYKMH